MNLLSHNCLLLTLWTSSHNFSSKHPIILVIFLLTRTFEFIYLSMGFTKNVYIINTPGWIYDSNNKRIITLKNEVTYWPEKCCQHPSFISIPRPLSFYLTLEKPQMLGSDHLNKNNRLNSWWLGSCQTTQSVPVGWILGIMSYYVVKAPTQQPLVAELSWNIPSQLASRWCQPG